MHTRDETVVEAMSCATNVLAITDDEIWPTNPSFSRAEGKQVSVQLIDFTHYQYMEAYIKRDQSFDPTYALQDEYDKDCKEIVQNMSTW